MSHARIWTAHVSARAEPQPHAGGARAILASEPRTGPGPGRAGGGGGGSRSGPPVQTPPRVDRRHRRNLNTPNYTY
eukprot:scaffold7246_cov410-Prasinococcus_capsulatus_cf.AAC.15